MEEKTYTEEQLRRQQRAAYFAGAHFGGVTFTRDTVERIEDQARHLYPIRKKVPRVVVDTEGRSWRIGENGSAQVRGALGAWVSTIGGMNFVLTAERLRLLADLLANPFDIVEE